MASVRSLRAINRLLRTFLVFLGSGLAFLILGILGAVQLKPEFRPLSPADGSTEVHPGRVFKIRFTNPEMHSDVKVSLRSQQGGKIAVSVNFDASEQLITVKPRTLLKPLTTYTLCFSRTSSSPFHSILRASRGMNNCFSFVTADTRSVRAQSKGAAGLIVTASTRPYTSYYEEILKAEGLNLFDSTAEDHFDPRTLDRYAVVLLAASSLPVTSMKALENWVQAGGSLIAIRPGKHILSRMCLIGHAKPPLRRAYLRALSGVGAAEKFARWPLQLHGEIDQHEVLPGCKAEITTVAHLYAAANMKPPSVAIAMRRLGYGTITTFSYDLARSIVYTRQGNPNWVNQERDGSEPRRPNDLFYPDHLDRNLMAVPQADEHQRLLANLIITTAPIPLPRYWYFPGTRRAAIVMVGDDHATRNGTATLFAKMRDESVKGCRLEQWECLRATALLTLATSIPPTLVQSFHEQGFEFGVHVDTDCANQGAAQLEQTLRKQMGDFWRRYPFLSQQTTQRLHCIVWNGWTETAQTQSKVGIRFDMNYYNWPPAWLGGRPGFMTGSGMPMPFVTEDGRALNIYQAATQLINEDKVPQVEGVHSMIERALGPDQFFSAFVAHYDFSDDYADILVDVALRRGVALVSAEQMLAWVDARNGSRFTNITWSKDTLRFTKQLAAGAEPASVLLPIKSSRGGLASIQCDGETLAFTTQEIKGLSFASFSARAGNCEARYVREAG
jgi:hypothetical protein